MASPWLAQVKNESVIRNEELSKKSEKAKLYFSKHSRKVSYK